MELVHFRCRILVAVERLLVSPQAQFHSAASATAVGRTNVPLTPHGSNFPLLRTT
jgi:hypothetical protein